MSAPAPTPPRGMWPVRAAAIALAAGLLAASPAAWVTGQLGYGSDFHVLRSAGLGVCVFAGVLVALLWPARWPVRAAVVAMGLAASAAAWVFLPSHVGGISLAAAVKERDAIKARIAGLRPDRLDDAHRLRVEIEALWADYPSMGHGLDDEFAEWGQKASDGLAAEIRQTSRDDLDWVIAFGQEARALDELFPGRAAAAADELRVWATEAAKRRGEELYNPSATPPHILDPAAFDRTAADRRALAEAFHSVRRSLDSAEKSWARAWVASQGIGIPLFAGNKPDAKTVRILCKRFESDLLALHAIDDSPKRFLEARRPLFETAHRAAQAEVRKHIAAGRPDNAQTVATGHALDWFATAELLDDDEPKKLADLRESCRLLAVLFEDWGGPPELALEPRPRETAPEPRPRP